jgi:ParB-like chromosome segregation protein Spo0J
MAKLKKCVTPGMSEFDLADLNAAKYNPRTISDEAMAGLTKSIERFGCVEPIVVNVRGGRNRIVGGHQRLKALLGLGHRRATCVTVDCGDAAEKLLNITLNSQYLRGEFTDGLNAVIASIRSGIKNDQALLDLRIDKLSREIETAEPDAGDKDKVPEQQYQVLVECEDESAQKKLYERLRKQGYECRLLTL